MKRILISGLIILALLSTSIFAMATPQIAKKTGKMCGYCHMNAKSPNASNLNAAGQYYRKHGSLTGYTGKSVIKIHPLE